MSLVTYKRFIVHGRHWTFVTRVTSRDGNGLVLLWKIMGGRRYRVPGVHGQVQRAVATGRLIKLPCVICGDPISQGHHPDYSRPLDVVWLCSYHHSQVHRYMRQGEHDITHILTLVRESNRLPGGNWDATP